MKKNVLFLVIGFSVASNSSAMLTQFSKKSLYFSQLKRRNFFEIPSGSGTLVYGEKVKLSRRQRHLVDAIGEDDDELVNFLLKKGESIAVNDIMKSGSVKMIKVFEKYGTNVQEICTSHGNLLHHAIQQPLKGKACL